MSDIGGYVSIVGKQDDGPGFVSTNLPGFMVPVGCVARQ
jgi:hypothetical protein